MVEARTAASPANISRPAASRLPLLVMALIALTPLVAAVIAYVWLPRDAKTNYGQLLPVGPAPDIAGVRLDGTPFRLSALKGKWLLLHVASGECPQACEGELYATRQARTIQGRERERIERVWLVPEGPAPAAGILEQHPGIVVARVSSQAVARLPAGAAAIYLIDPLGNLVLQYPEQPDIKALSKDLGQLLRASSIG